MLQSRERHHHVPTKEEPINFLVPHMAVWWVSLILEIDRAQVFILHTQIHPTVFKAGGIASLMNKILSQGLEKFSGCYVSSSVKSSSWSRARNAN